mgnify:CR=1 FL=1
MTNRRKNREKRKIDRAEEISQDIFVVVVFVWLISIVYKSIMAFPLKFLVTFLITYHYSLFTSFISFSKSVHH